MRVNECNGDITTVEAKGDGLRICSCDMEPGEKFIRGLLKFVFMILVFIIAIVFGEVFLVWAGLAR
jgi:hypothetical protein